MSGSGAPWVDPRPGAVTTGGVLAVLLGIFGVLATLLVGGLVVALGFFIDALAQSKGGAETDQVSPIALVAGVVVVAVGVLLSALHVFLGARVLRGGSVARVVLTAWDGVAVLAGLVGTFASLAALLDGGSSPLLVLLPVLALAMPLAVVVCLWVPASNAWFARVAQQGQQAQQGPWR
ncbi:hypothetical protein [uncultured Nocardioides sp.]|uniref:hypothetical protein n=1 Tax=uncultured Nocardioides sp. TaxID=198441 RepID=UPI00261AFD81|nr:hypothetical protein [uncultured Nocardioides sp.]